MRAVQRWIGVRRGGFAVFLLYLLGAVLVTAGAWRGPTSGWAGRCCDQEQAIWYLGWTPHALANGLNPFFTTQIGAPPGVNLMWSPSMPLLGLIGWLPAKLGGPIFGFNVLVVLAISLSGLTAWLAIRRWTGGGLGPIVGGAVYAFSPYVASHAALHLNLATAWVPPLVLVVLDDVLVTRRRPPWQLGVALGLLGGAQLLISEELLATGVIAAAVLVSTMALTLRIRFRARLISTLAVGAATFLTLAGWPLAVQFLGPQRVTAPVQDPTTFSTDLLNLVLPTPYQLIAPSAATRMSRDFSGLYHEATAYLGVPLLILIVVASARWWGDPRLRIAGITGASMLVLSLGPWLHIGKDVVRVPLPWLALGKLPLLEQVLPGRMTVYVWLAAAVIVAVIVTRAGHLPALSAAAWVATVGLSLVLLLPAPLPRAPFATPAFFRDWSAQHIGPNETVLVAPYFVNGGEAAPMVWAAQAGYGLRMPEAYAYLPQPGGGTYSGPAQSQLTFTMFVIQQRGAWLVAHGDIRRQIADDLRAADIRHVIVGPTQHWQQLIAFFTDLFGHGPDLIEGVALWRDVAVR